MSRFVKAFLLIVLLILSSVTVPLVGFLLTLSVMSAEERKSKFSGRPRLREWRAKKNGSLAFRLFFWFRKAIWPHFRASKRIILDYYCRPRTVVAISACGSLIILAVLILAHHVNIEATSDYLSYGLWQVAITGCLAISIGALAWILFSIEFAFKSTFVTLIISVIISTCVVCARLLAIDFFSKTFPFPPTYAPVAFGIATTLLTASITSIVFALLALLFEIYFLFILGSKFERNKIINILLLIASAVGLLGAWLTTYALFEAIDPKGQLLIIKIAEKYDFTSNHMCDASSDEVVLFIENVADRAIAARFPDVGTVRPRNITKDGVGKYMPTSFHTVRCNPIDPAINKAGWCDQGNRLGYCHS